MGQDTTGFSRVVPHFNLTPRQNRTDTIGFSRMVLQFQPKRGPEKETDTIGFSRMVLQFQPKAGYVLLSSEARWG